MCKRKSHINVRTSDKTAYEKNPLGVMGGETLLKREGRHIFFLVTYNFSTIFLSKLLQVKLILWSWKSLISYPKHFRNFLSWALSGKIQSNRLSRCRVKLFVFIKLLARLDIIFKCILYIFKIYKKSFVIIQERTNWIPDTFIQKWYHHVSSILYS